MRIECLFDRVNLLPDGDESPFMDQNCADIFCRKLAGEKSSFAGKIDSWFVSGAITGETLRQLAADRRSTVPGGGE